MSFLTLFSLSSPTEMGLFLEQDEEKERGGRDWRNRVFKQSVHRLLTSPASPEGALPYHAVPCHAVLFNTIPYHSTPYHAIPYHAIPCHTIPFHTVPYYTILYNTIPCHTIPCHSTPYHTMPYHAMPCHVILWHTKSCHTIPCCTMPYHTMPYHAIPYLPEGPIKVRLWPPPAQSVQVPKLLLFHHLITARWSCQEPQLIMISTEIPIYMALFVIPPWHDMCRLEWFHIKWIFSAFCSREWSLATQKGNDSFQLEIQGITYILTKSNWSPWPKYVIECTECTSI